LQYKYKGKSIAEILALTITEAVEYFGNHKKLKAKLEEVKELGLGYLQLGQSSSTLSGGEGQRLILEAALQKMKKDEQCLIILDEPGSGLHPADITGLTAFLEKLVERKHTVIFIDHNMQLLIKTNWLIELGPAGGGAGGKKIFEGRPAELLVANTPSGIAIRNYMEN
jgi:excinuclease ABC subunit A